MNVKNSLVAVVMFAACQGASSNMSAPSSRADTPSQLANILNGKRLSCTSAAGTEAFAISVDGETTKIRSEYGDGEPEDKHLTQISVGGLLMLAIEGPDGDE